MPCKHAWNFVCSSSNREAKDRRKLEFCQGTRMPGPQNGHKHTLANLDYRNLENGFDPSLLSKIKSKEGTNCAR